MNPIQTGLYSIEQVTEQYLQQSKQNVTDSKKEALSFQDVLKNTVESSEQKVIFSKHANKRLESRNISLSDEQVARLHNGIEKAREKSIKESLVMMDNIAFVVNVKNNTVITALDQSSDEGQIFTNIDGAVII